MMMPVTCNTEKFLSNICRLCLKQENSMSSIFEGIDNESNDILAEKITSIARVEISQMDGLPLSICHLCRRQVNQFHEFRLLVEISDKALRTCLKTTQLQETKTALESDLFEDIEQYEYRELFQNQTDEFNSNKDIMNYALLVPTTDGLQVWKVSDVEPNEDLNKFVIRNDSNLINKNHDDAKTMQRSKTPKIFTDSMQLQQNCSVTKPHEDEIRGTDDNEQLQLRKNETMNCQLCNNEFKSLKDLKNHITEHCLSCDNIVPDQENTVDNQQIVINTNLLVGVNEHLLTDRSKQDAAKLKPNKAKESPRAKLFKCRYCNKLFSRLTLKKHHEKCQLKEVKLICNECGEQFTKKSELRYHKGTHLASPLMCSTCNKFFRNIQSFKMHMKRHTLGSRYNCETCGQSYYTNSELARHVQKHEEKRKYPCHLCDMSFLSKPELNRHMKYHNGVKQFVCNLCCKSYYESGHLKIHQRVHTGERPFVCQVCSKGFVTRSKLARHSKIHAKEV